MRRPLGLRPRLLAVVSFIPPGHRVADIGTDHARLPAFLVQRDIALHVIATDIASGPLERAARTLRIHRLQDRIELKQCDGAQGIDSDEVDTAVIAGMGGDSILAIIKDSPWLMEKNLIVQPMTRIDRVKAIGFTNEIQVSEGRRLYSILQRSGCHCP